MEPNKPEYCCPECSAETGKSWPDDYRADSYSSSENPEVEVCDDCGHLLVDCTCDIDAEDEEDEEDEEDAEDDSDETN